MSNLPHFLLRMPNWLGDVVMAAPVVCALRRQRALHLSLLIQAHFIPLAKALNLADEYLPLPPKSWRYYLQIADLRKHDFDAQILFANSERSDLEARVIGAKERYGIEAGRRRWLLNRRIDIAHLPSAHQTFKLAEFLTQAKLLDEIKLDLTPRKITRSEDIGSARIGLICGTENMPSKRWAIANWRALLQQLLAQAPDMPICLYGTAKDKAITQEVCRDMPANVRDMAGTTNLMQFASALANTELLICNDTGGMHLANALGCKVVAIFGPTNPLATAPIFNTAKVILQGEDCPETGGGDINAVSPEQVLQAALGLLA